MKKTMLILTLILSFYSCGKETTTEKVKSSSNSFQRTMKKGYHRVTEFTCLKGKLECETQKTKNRISEAKEEIVDETKELTNKLD